MITSPLWDLTKLDVEWEWKRIHQESFEEIKHSLTTCPVMAYWNQEAETRITTDASQFGIGAILEQKQADNSYRPIYYASRKLTKVESRYSQFERECLGVKWACSRFFLYLTGKEFEVRTDHKQLVQVLTPKYKAPSARIERWLLYLQQFRFSVTHIKGKDNYADILSRIPDDR